MTQPREAWSGKHAPVAFMSKGMDTTMEGYTEPERWLAAAYWAVRRMRWYLAFAPVTVYIPDRAIL